MPVITASRAPLFTYSMPSAGPQPVPQLTVRGYTAPSRGAKETCVWHVTFAPGLPRRGGVIDHEYIAVVLSGSVEAILDGVQHSLNARDAIMVPANTPISLANPHDEPAEMIEVLPVGARVTFPDEDPFVPPWAE